MPALGRRALQARAARRAVTTFERQPAGAAREPLDLDELVRCGRARQPGDRRDVLVADRTRVAPHRHANTLGSWLEMRSFPQLGGRARRSRRLGSPAPIADGEHARADAYVSPVRGGHTH